MICGNNEKNFPNNIVLLALNRNYLEVLVGISATTLKKSLGGNFFTFYLIPH